MLDALAAFLFYAPFLTTIGLVLTFIAFLGKNT
jgi:hypothetical protein